MPEDITEKHPTQTRDAPLLMAIAELMRLAESIRRHPEQWDINLLTRGCEAMARTWQNHA